MKVAKRDPRDIALAGFTLTAVGVEVEGQPTIEEWRTAMQFIDRAASASMWWHGDMLRYGEATYGELASQDDGDEKYDYKTLRNAKYVAENVPMSRRRDTLSFGHHEVVAPLSPDQQVKWLDQAESETLTRSELRRVVADARAAETIAATPLPKGKHNVIYADPPWRYDFSVSDSRKIENQYPTMEVDQICEIDVNSITADDAVLFMWGTSPKLIEAFTGMGEVWQQVDRGLPDMRRAQHNMDD